MIRRQDLGQRFRVYSTDIFRFGSYPYKPDFLGQNVGYIEGSKLCGLDIDDHHDFLIAKAVYEARLMNLRNILQNLKAEISEVLPTVISLRADFEYKADGSPVSKADILLEHLVTSFVEKKLPQYCIIGEESFVGSGEKVELKNVVYVDPIDGTENFVSGLREVLE